MTIFEKLSAIQEELKAPKNQYNSFGKYAYRSCEDILEAVKPICRKHETALTISDTLRNIGDRYYVEAIVTLYDAKEPDNNIQVTAYAREEESKKGADGSQITGASSSYARKYALNGLFNIDDSKDSDATNDGTEPKKQETKKSEPKADDCTCDRCKRKIEDYVDANGKTVSAKRLAAGSKEKYGQTLCMSCINELYPRV